jgi:hypothetical protein
MAAKQEQKLKDIGGGSSWKAEDNKEEKSKMITSYESQRQLDIAAVKALILTTQITGTHTHK